MFIRKGANIRINMVYIYNSFPVKIKHDMPCELAAVDSNEMSGLIFSEKIHRNHFTLILCVLQKLFTFSWTDNGTSVSITH